LPSLAGWQTKQNHENRKWTGRAHPRNFCFFSFFLSLFLKQWGVDATQSYVVSSEGKGGREMESEEEEDFLYVTFSSQYREWGRRRQGTAAEV
jgi:hypothetical protein